MRKSIVSFMICALLFGHVAGCGPSTAPVEPGEFAPPPGAGEATAGAKKSGKDDRAKATESMD